MLLTVRDCDQQWQRAGRGRRGWGCQPDHSQPPAHDHGGKEREDPEGEEAELAGLATNSIVSFL